MAVSEITIPPLSRRTLATVKFAADVYSSLWMWKKHALAHPDSDSAIQDQTVHYLLGHLYSDFSDLHFYLRDTREADRITLELYSATSGIEFNGEFCSCYSEWVCNVAEGICRGAYMGCYQKVGGFNDPDRKPFTPFPPINTSESIAKAWSGMTSYCYPIVEADRVKMLLKTESLQIEERLGGSQPLDLPNSSGPDSKPNSDLDAAALGEKRALVHPYGTPIPAHFGVVVGSEQRWFGPVIGTQKMLGATTRNDWSGKSEVTHNNWFKRATSNDRPALFARESGDGRIEGYYLSQAAFESAKVRATNYGPNDVA